MQQIFGIHSAAFVIFPHFLHGVVGHGYGICRAEGNAVSAAEAVAGNCGFPVCDLQYAKKAVLHTQAAANAFFLIDGYHILNSFLCKPYKFLFFSIAQGAGEVNRTVE